MSRPRAAGAGEILIITHPQQFCQGKSAKKLHKVFSQNLCNLSIVISDLLGYNNNTRRGDKATANYQKISKKN